MKRHRDPPAEMMAAAIDRFGPPSVLRPHRLPVPRPSSTQVLIELDHAGVGVWDGEIRQGSWKPPGKVRFPLIPGTDGAGVIAAVGSRVRRFRVGDRVYAYEFGNKKGGFYAEFVVCGARHVGHVPRTLSPPEAGACATTGLTAMRAVDLLSPRRGETILVHGATGAVGTLAVQFALHRGCRVVATGSGPRARTLLRRLGASAVLDARRPDAPTMLRRLAPTGLDGVLAFAGGPGLRRLLGEVKAGGRLVYPNGIEDPPKRRRGLAVRAFDAVASPESFLALGRLITAARVSVPIAATYPLRSADRAHRRLAQGHLLGRIVLRVRPS